MSLEYLKRTLDDTQVIELRHLWKKPGYTIVRSGLFDDIELLENAIRELEEYGNLYTTLNRTEAAATNALVKGEALSDSDITLIMRLPFDFDPARAADTASTDEQVHAARLSSQRLMQALSALGWPMPLSAMSGNGYHLQYRCCLPATPETKQMLSILYKGLRQEYGTELVDFDPSVRNPSRIFRLYGTVNRKGNDKSLWRQATCVIPPQWMQVSHKQIERLAESYRPAPRKINLDPDRVFHGRGNYKTLDVVAWFTAHGSYIRHIEDHKHAVTCPWEHEHSESSYNDTIIFEKDGSWPGFHCKHLHCDGRDIKHVIKEWRDADKFCGGTQ